MTNRLFLYLFLLANLIFSGQSFALDNPSCIGDARIFYKHLRADELIQTTAKLINKEILHPNIITGLKKYFKLDTLDVNQHALIEKVFSNINKVNKKNTKANYRCDPENETRPCNATNYAGMQFIGKMIYLCPGYFTKLTDIQQVGVMLHQWFHAWGSKIARSKEKSCRDTESQSADILVKQADQYMQFIYFVGSNGSFLECF